MKIARTYSSFFSGSKKLRREFDSVFRNERDSNAKRFCFEPWSVPGQYYQLRTPAYSFFEPNEYMRFHEALVQFGRTQLGCHDVSPPWLSLYLDGHYQELHCDAPHGPWAFVYSLTKNQKLCGGMTEILNPETLDFSKRTAGFREKDHVLDRVPPRFGQLLVFDGRFPHRVSPVREAFHPCDGRLVIHGWFLNPRPFISGPITVAQVSSRLQNFETELVRFSISPENPGVFNFKVTVSASGRVSGLKVLASTLYGSDRSRVALAVNRFWKNTEWKKSKARSEIVIPLVWD